MPDLTLIELLHGKHAHADSIACVEGVTPELAGRQIADFPHSIWQLVFHMNYWMDYELKRIHGQHPAYPDHAAESWPPHSAPANENEWTNAVARFKTLIEKLAELAGSSSEVLHRNVEVLHSSESQASMSVVAVAWQTAVHNTYHIGQVALLRRVFGVWPPQGGGDTW
jgi:uncharacterized damage-inducible protein DinB